MNLDLYLHKLIGWAVSRRIDAELALCHINRRSKPVNRHEIAFIIPIAAYSIWAKIMSHCSRSVAWRTQTLPRAPPTNNTIVESFMKTIKLEEVYDEKRVHSGIGYLTPSELQEGIMIEPSFARRF